MLNKLNAFYIVIILIPGVCSAKTISKNNVLVDAKVEEVNHVQEVSSSDFDGVNKVKYRTVIKGSFKENVKRLVERNGYKHVMWDKAVDNCEWKQETVYTIPLSVANTAEAVIAFYAKTQDFFPEFSAIDKHVFMSYRGNPTNLTLCSKD
ncbi:hypothetical protein KW507_15875 [Vibrio fluvialis]|nr:hypothetical protein [Vibrio fluvialis]